MKKCMPYLIVGGYLLVFTAVTYMFCGCVTTPTHSPAFHSDRDRK